MQHQDLSLPEDLHYSKFASVGRAGQITRCNGNGTESLVQAHFGGYDLIFSAGVTSYTLIGEPLAANYLVVSGACGDVSMVVPDSYGPVLIENAFSGSQTITVRCSGTGVQAAIPVGQRQLVMSKGGNVVGVLQGETDGYAEISLTDLSTYTLTTSNCSKQYLRFTGTPTADLTLVFPDGWTGMVENAMSGTHTLTLSMDGTGTTYTLKRGRIQVIFLRPTGVATLIPDVLCGHLDVDLAGLATLTLSEAQARSSSLRFTGALTENCVVTVPDSMDPFVVENATTGAFTLTLARASGGTGLVVTQTKRVLALARVDAVVACTPEV